jgi:hypothetical protein
VDVEHWFDLETILARPVLIIIFGDDAFADIHYQTRGWCQEHAACLPRRVGYTACLPVTSITEGPLFQRISARLRMSEWRQVKPSASALPGWLK